MLHEADTADPNFYQEDISSDSEEGKDLVEIYLEAGLKIDDKDEVRPDIKNEDKPLLLNLLTAFTAAEKGHHLLAASAKLAASVVSKSMDLERLSELFRSVEIFDRQAVQRARTQAKEENVSLSLKRQFRPKIVDKNTYECRICSDSFGSYTGCDSHIRAKHSNIMYGPCCKECSFTSFNRDSYKRHKSNCPYKNETDEDL